MNRSRCDGCGQETMNETRYLDDDSDEIVAKYCPGCELRRQNAGVDPGDHEQYRLEDELDERLVTDGGSTCVNCGATLPEEIENATGVYCTECGHGQHVPEDS